MVDVKRCGVAADAPFMWHGKQQELLGRPATRRIYCSRPEGHEGPHMSGLDQIAWTVFAKGEMVAAR